MNEKRKEVRCQWCEKGAGMEETDKSEATLTSVEDRSTDKPVDINPHTAICSKPLVFLSWHDMCLTLGEDLMTFCNEWQ